MLGRGARSRSSSSGRSRATSTCSHRAGRRRCWPRGRSRSASRVPRWPGGPCRRVRAGAGRRPPSSAWRRAGWLVGRPGQPPRDVPAPARAACPAAGRRAAGSTRTCPPGAQVMTIGPSMANIGRSTATAARRAVGQPEPAQPQPVLRADRQPRPRAAPRRASSTRSGTRSPRPLAVLRRRLLRYVEQVPRHRRPHRDDHRPAADGAEVRSPPSSSTRSGHEARGRRCAGARAGRPARCRRPRRRRPPTPTHRRRRSSTSSC